MYVSARLYNMWSRGSCVFVYVFVCRRRRGGGGGGGGGCGQSVDHDDVSDNDYGSDFLDEEEYMEWRRTGGWSDDHDDVSDDDAVHTSGTGR